MFYNLICYSIIPIIDASIIVMFYQFYQNITAVPNAMDTLLKMLKNTSLRFMDEQLMSFSNLWLWWLFNWQLVNVIMTCLNYSTLKFLQLLYFCYIWNDYIFICCFFSHLRIWMFVLTRASIVIWINCQYPSHTNIIIQTHAYIQPNKPVFGNGYRYEICLILFAHFSLTSSISSDNISLLYHRT